MPDRCLLLFALAAALGATGCRGRAPKPAAQGPIVARVGPATISSEEFQQKASIQSPMVRASFTSLERKKEFLDRLIRLELLMQESAREGFDKDEEVVDAKKAGMSTDGLRQKMANEMVHDKFDKDPSLKEIPEADSRAYYDAHRSEYVKPDRVRLEVIFLKGKEGDRKIREESQRMLADLKDKAAKGNGGFFATTARVRSDDEATKPRGGDTGFKTEADLTQAYGPAVARAAMALKAQDDLAELLRGETGWYLVKLKARQNAMNEDFDQARSGIEARLRNDKRTALIDAWVAELRAKAPVVVYDAELSKIDLQPSLPAPTN